ncbi:MAG: M14 family zinc carboxypeptidase [Bryobacter sp.]|nr:M14 family zinc carboxypeptidase [Bryobacter sp.]
MHNNQPAPFRSEVIGTSHLGQPLNLRIYGPASRPLRVFVICGQHGDERAIRKALRHFLEEHAPTLSRSIPFLQLAVLADANPDGLAARTRANAQGIDLNRDHVQLRAPETRAIHEFIRSWRPHLVVDLHNYPSRRKHLVDQRLRLGWDVCLEIPTTPAAGCSAEQPPFANLFECLNRVSHKAGFHFGRYGLFGADGSFRHGTPLLGDARNTLTLRYEVPTLLLEVRNPSRSDLPPDRHLLRTAVAATLWEIALWAVREAKHLLEFELPSNPGTRVPYSFRRRPALEGKLPVRHLDNGTLSFLPLARDRRKIQARRHRSLPPSYSLHPYQWQALELLQAHGYQFTKAPQCSCWEVSLSQVGGRLLALLLDQDSPYSLRRRQPEAASSNMSGNQVISGEICHD